MAHEVGHLLQGKAYSPRGFMGAKWNMRVLGAISRGLLVFSGSPGLARS